MSERAHAERPADIALQAIQTGSPEPIILGDAPEENTPSSGLDKNTIVRLVAAGFSYFFAGANDGSLGAVTPYILRTYNVGTQYVSIIYAVTFVGWLVAAATNSYVAQYLDLGAILTLGATIQLVAQLPRFYKPPFGLYVITFFLQALGMGYQDAHGNTYVASIKGAHKWLGFIHAMYALGSLVSPFVVTPIAAQLGEQQWQLCYLFLVGIGTINLVSVPLAFRSTFRTHAKPAVVGEDELGSAASAGNETTSRGKAAAVAMKNTLKSPSVYILSLFYFFMLGVGITAGGWVVEYLISTRDGKLPEVGYVPSGLWGGIFLGRLLLAEPTHRLGERRMTMLYCVIILALQLVFWQVPNLISSAVSLCILGFFFGPLFATGMSIASKLFPEHIRPTALGFVFVLAQAGGALFPALTGLIASKTGVKAMQPMLLVLIIAMGMAWALVPKVKHRDD